MSRMSWRAALALLAGLGAAAAQAATDLAPRQSAPPPRSPVTAPAPASDRAADPASPSGAPAPSASAPNAAPPPAGSELAARADVMRRLGSLLGSAPAREILRQAGDAAPPEAEAPPPEPVEAATMDDAKAATDDTEPETPKAEPESADTAAAESPATASPPDPMTAEAAMMRKPAMALSGDKARVLCLSPAPGSQVLQMEADGEAILPYDVELGAPIEAALGPETRRAFEEEANRAQRVAERDVPVLLADVFADLLPACALVEATDVLLGPRKALEPAPEPQLDPAWRQFYAQFIAAPHALQSQLAERLGGLFAQLGRGDLVPLLEAYRLNGTPTPIGTRREALKQAYLLLAEGQSEPAFELLQALAADDDKLGQHAAVLLAERLDPEAEGAEEQDWLALFDHVGSIATENAGTALGERAVLAELRLARTVFGEEIALHTLALARRRGLVPDHRLEEANEIVRTEPSSEVPEVIALPLWVLDTPDVFETLASSDVLQQPLAERATQSEMDPALFGGRVAGADAAPRTAEARAEAGDAAAAAGDAAARRTERGPTDWRSLISKAGPVVAKPAGSEDPDAPDEPATAQTPGAGPRAGPGTPPVPSLAAGPGRAPRPGDEPGAVPAAAAGATPDLIDEIEAFLERTDRELETMEETLADG
ncbi:MAG: hypothetical protein AAFV49_10855 [Pseudomonadota bacterium]